MTVDKTAVDETGVDELGINLKTCSKCEQTDLQS